MKEIKILNLKLRNFKGIKDFELNLDGKNVNIYGDNGIGKTTIMDAFIWLLFSKDSLNSSTFDIKTQDENGNSIHGLEHEVCARLLVNDKEINLRKVYYEKWVKKRGETNKTLDGHTTDHYINETLIKRQSDYATYLNNIIDEDTFRVLTNPLYFNTVLEWQDRKKILLGLCEEISHEDVFKENNSLNELEDLLKDESIDDVKKKMKTKIKVLKEEYEPINYRIDELSRGNIEVDVEALNKEKEALEEKLNKLKNSKAVDYKFQIRSITGTIKMLENEIKDLERNLTEKIRADLDNANKSKYNLEKAVHESDSKALKLSSNATGLVDLIEKMEKEIENLREEFLDIRVTEFKKELTICPTCQQALPSEKVEVLVKEFEENKANKLRKINETGKQKKGKFEKVTKELRQTEKELAEIKAELETTNLMLEGKKKEIAAYEKEIESIDVTSLKEYKENKAQIEKLEKEKLDIEKISEEEDRTEAIQELENQILIINKDLAKVDLIKENKKRVADLMKKERELAQLIANAEKIEDLCKEYEVTKSNIMADSINNLFKNVKFRFQHTDAKGKKYGETCIAQVNTNGALVDYGTNGNNAAMYTAGLDIISRLSKYYKVTAPIFIDNRESVNQIPDMNAQVINLIVSKHKSLRVEVQE